MKNREFKFNKRYSNTELREIITFNVTSNIRVAENKEKPGTWILQILGKRHLFKRNEWYNLIDYNTNSLIMFMNASVAIEYVRTMFEPWRSDSKTNKEKFFKIISAPIEDWTYDEIMFCYRYEETPYSTKLIIENELKKRNIKTK